MLLLVVFGGGCDVRNPQPMDAEYCNCNWQMDAVYKHEHDEHESWWHHLRCNIPSTTLPWPLHAKSITAQTKCVHMPLVGGFESKYRCAAAPHSYPTKHHIYTAIQSGFEPGPCWARLKKPSDFFLKSIQSYNVIQYLVGGFNLPLWKMMELKSVGLMTFPIWWENNPAMFQSTNQYIDLLSPY
jgi:hypothetical protein